MYVCMQIGLRSHDQRLDARLLKEFITAACRDEVHEHTGLQSSESEQTRESCESPTPWQDLALSEFYGSGFLVGLKAFKEVIIGLSA